MRSPFIGIVGSGGVCTPSMEELAAEVGREVARKGAVLVCGGLKGVMTAAARGAKEIEGITIGIIPGSDTSAANEYIDFPIATNMGFGRNNIIVHTADVLISIGGGYGTLSEIALALKAGKSVVALLPQFQIAGIITVSTAVDAVSEALTLIELGRKPVRIK